MNKKLILALLLFSFFNFQCSKESTNQAVIDVSAITSTDALGNITASIDNTDWKQDNNWTAAETALLEAPSASQLAGTETAVIEVYPSFPNPAATVANFAFRISKVTLAQIVITDNMLVVKKRTFFQPDIINFNTLLFSFENTAYSNNANYRMYYAFYSEADGMYYKGHGDLRVQR